MHKHDVKRGVVVLVVFLIVINFSQFTQAFGISASYLANDTLKVLPGSNYTYTLTIQNGENEDYYVDISYSSTKDVASLKETAYLVQSHTYNKTVIFDIIIPSKAKLGDNYILEYIAKPRTNSTSAISPSLEILGHINILVADESIASSNSSSIKKGNWHGLRTYFLMIIIVILIALIVNRVWKISKGISSKISNARVTSYTISEAMNLKEVQELLEKLSDEEFRLPEIRNLFKEKISELTTHHLSRDIQSMSRKDAIKAIENIK
jgi:hypothetical protein